MRHGLIARVALILWAASWTPGAEAQSERAYGPTGQECRCAPVTPAEQASVEGFFLRNGTVHQIEFGPAEDAIFLVENSLDNAVSNVLRRLAGSDDREANVLVRRQFEKFLGQPIEGERLEAFCRELYGIPGRSRGLLNGSLLEESLHI